MTTITLELDDEQIECLTREYGDGPSDPHNTLMRIIEQEVEWERFEKTPEFTGPMLEAIKDIDIQAKEPYRFEFLSDPKDDQYTRLPGRIMQGTCFVWSIGDDGIQCLVDFMNAKREAKK